MEVIRMNSSKFLSMLVVMGLIASPAFSMDENLAHEVLATTVEQTPTEQVAQAGLTDKAREALAWLNSVGAQQVSNHPYIAYGSLGAFTLGGTVYVVKKTGLYEKTTTGLKKVTGFVKEHKKSVAGTVAALGITGLAAAQYNGNINALGWATKAYNALPNRPNLMRMPNVTLPSWVKLPSMDSVKAYVPAMPSWRSTAIFGTAAAGLTAAAAIRQGKLTVPDSVANTASSASSSVSSAASRVRKLVVTTDSASSDAASDVVSTAPARWTGLAKNAKYFHAISQARAQSELDAAIASYETAKRTIVIKDKALIDAAIAQKKTELS
jgi:hypothetical protein